jgi:hypothetical protein
MQNWTYKALKRVAYIGKLFFAKTPKKLAFLALGTLVDLTLKETNPDLARKSN